ncbi:hypothetical protein BGZ97_008901 [Linnemannia gamsii]|uniref:Uncharacterized protein n=1 Tax=Linnemannia gamsii TaxID=64522 RepID=A0A9P6R9M8_9FUNG|nr:hypothetical protein BGZ97_008901 [Linnemannia gamsii]
MCIMHQSPLGSCHHHQQVRQIQPGSNSSGSENEDHRIGHVASPVEEPQESDWEAFSHAILSSARPAATAVKDARVPATAVNAYVAPTMDANTSSNTNNHQNSIPHCSGTTVGQTPCQRPGKNPVTESNQVRYYCRQHDPRLADRRCLGYVASAHRQCFTTCSVKEIRAGGRPICNTHIRPGARLISRA